MPGLLPRAPEIKVFLLLFLQKKKTLTLVLVNFPNGLNRGIDPTQPQHSGKPHRVVNHGCDGCTETHVIEAQ
jgi:hypothetical protein